MPNRNKNATVLFYSTMLQTSGLISWCRFVEPLPLLILRPSLIKIVSRMGNSFLTSKNANGSIFSLFFDSLEDFWLRFYLDPKSNVEQISSYILSKISASCKNHSLLCYNDLMLATDVGYEMCWSQRLGHKHPSEVPSVIILLSTAQTVTKKSYHQHLCSRLFRYYIDGSGPLNLTFFCVLSIRSISLSSIWAFYVCFS